MRKAMVPLAVILSVMTILLAAVWMRYARDIRELETRVDSSVVYDRHYIMIAQDNSRMWQTIYESARDTAAGESVYLEWAGWGGADEYTAADCMQIAIASRVDGIILYTDGDSRISDLIDEAMEQGIPVVTVMNDDTESRRVSYVGVNHYQLGNICGEQVLELLEEGENRIMMISGSAAGDVGTNLMYSQMNQVIARGKKADQTVKISTYTIEGNTNFDAEEAIRDIFVNSQTVPDILICMDTISAECACQAVVDYNQVGKVDVIGYYASETIADGVERGLLSMTVALDMEEMGDFCVGALNEYLDLGYVSNYFNVGLDVLTRDNVNRYLAAQADEEA